MTTERIGRNLIYGLIDPRNQCLRYIGKTHKRREIRLAEHISEAEEGGKGYVYNWIRSLLAQGMEPEIFVLERVPPEEDWQAAEKANIAFWRDHKTVTFPYVHPPQTAKSIPTKICGVELTNIADGG